MTAHTPLPDQLANVEKLFERAKTEQDWPMVQSLKATAELIRWTMTHADAIRVAAAVVADPAVKAVREAFPEGSITAIRKT